MMALDFTSSVHAHCVGTASDDDYRKMRLAKRNEVEVIKPLTVRHDSGRRLRDFIWVSLEPFIHSRVVETMQTGKLTGWSVYPVEVYNREGHFVPEYHGLSITGRCGAMYLDRDHSEVVYEENKRGRFPYYRGLHITGESWDGSDVFTAADGKTGFIIVTERAKNLLKAHKVTNVNFVPVSEVRVYAMDQPKFLNAAADIT